MTDPRSDPDPSLVTLNDAAQVAVPLADLTRGAGGPRDRQLIYGDPLTVLNKSDWHCLVRSEKDGYCGTLLAAQIGPASPPSHRVTARATHAYSNANFKSAENLMLSFGTTVTALSEKPTFIETTLGFIPRQHLHSADTVATDPAAIAALFLGTPYLWGGNSSFGIDCSGLVQMACLACNIACPGDSDQQADGLGTLLPGDATLQKNDLIFWKGHVALVTDANTLIHANAGHMMVTYEPIADAIARIEMQGDGTPTHRKRLPQANSL
ncbi:MAG: NlpC/P60 family protein [Roseobacter sp.]